LCHKPSSRLLPPVYRCDSARSLGTPNFMVSLEAKLGLC